MWKDQYLKEIRDSNIDGLYDDHQDKSARNEGDGNDGGGSLSHGEDSSLGEESSNKGEDASEASESDGGGIKSTSAKAKHETKVLQKYTAQKTGMKKTYLSSGWNKEGKEFYKKMLKMVNRRNALPGTRDRYEETWAKMFGKTKFDSDEENEKPMKKRRTKEPPPPPKTTAMAIDEAAFDFDDCNDYC